MLSSTWFYDPFISMSAPKLDPTHWVVPSSPHLLEATVYGKRDGCVHGLAVTSRDRGNLFKSTRGWKQGCVHGIQMLQRPDMFKPEQDSWLHHGSHIPTRCHLCMKCVLSLTHLFALSPTHLCLPRQALVEECSCLIWAEK